MGWNYLSIPTPQLFNPIVYNGCNYLSLLGLKLNHLIKMGPWHICCKVCWQVVVQHLSGEIWRHIYSWGIVLLTCIRKIWWYIEKNIKVKRNDSKWGRMFSVGLKLPRDMTNKLAFIQFSISVTGSHACKSYVLAELCRPTAILCCGIP